MCGLEPRRPSLEPCLALIVSGGFDSLLVPGHFARPPVGAMSAIAINRKVRVRYAIVPVGFGAVRLVFSVGADSRYVPPPEYPKDEALQKNLWVKMTTG